MTTHSRQSDENTSGEFLSLGDAISDGTLSSNEGYYGTDANMRYMSASQIKSFIGTPGIPACEERAVMEAQGRWTRPESKALTIGSYIDVMLTGTEDEQHEFRESHPEMISSRGPTKGQLKAEYRAANDMISRAFADADNGGIFMRALTGKRQHVVTGIIGGHEFKGRLDVLGDGFITDLKTVESVNRRYYNDGYFDFISWWGYDLQGAIYQELVYQETGNQLPFYIACISKQTPCDIDLLQVPQDRLDEAFGRLTKDVLDRIAALKNGEEKPRRCGHCDWCRMTKVIRKPRILEVV